ncbi:hypothetical protein [Bdellovibrio sp. HCB337]|uniref:hypothetical protein n=1 Tax=Bdellovibrio sp. HCB337 TaxID=3394358 RepID=UPI0039A6E46A
MQKQKKEDKSSLLAVALLLLAGFFVFLFFLPEKDSFRGENGGVTQSKQFEERVNRHLFKTSQDMQLSREKMQLEANREAADRLARVPVQQDVHKLDLSTDPRAESLLQALGREVKESAGPTSPDEAVQADLFEAQQLESYSEEYKREYARQFVENARKAGYLIKLNDDYKVISIRPIRKPAENFELFESNGRAAR